MRKILLGTTAVVGAALLAPSFAAAQEAPTVRIGGFFRAYYGYTQQSGRNSTTPSGLANNTNGQGGNLTQSNTAVGGVNVPTTESLGVTSATSTAGAGEVGRLSKNDFSTDGEVHVFVNGKTANGLSYGAVIEIAFNQQEGRNIVQQRASTGKTTASIDEWYTFIASPTWGQIRFGDEDGPVGGLMNSGVITNFGTGGIYGDRESFVTRQASTRTTTSPGGLGDNTKIIYLSPQFFGFDFGASFAFNYGVGEDTGCPSNQSSGWCDSAYAFTGASNFGIAAAGPEQAVRRNEYQGALRWRGSLAGVGLSFTGGYVGSGAAKELSPLNVQRAVFQPLGVWQFGAQATAYGLTVGAQYEHGQSNFFWGNAMKGDRPMDQLFAGASYTVGPFTFGGNWQFQTVEGASRTAYGYTNGVLVTSPNPAGAGLMRRLGYGIGGNYRLAPGLDIVAEWSKFTVAERGRDLDSSRAGVQDRTTANVFILGTRLAF
ncbi:porin family protein [Paracraurococcus lichenis]|uniref:Porin n=1 Tax=Paracraurococcus lichenis TaxID=3064888 RepID=A0ABT9E3X6_9PROT|nr:porin [Paracraurococcus sp. LOR1-02]MDO9710863.1 porin [Paracraurococcus sp. LOR1-02]